MIKTQKLGIACCVINKLRIHERIMQNTWKPAGIIGNENKNFSSNLIQDFILYNGCDKICSCFNVYKTVSSIFCSLR
jgi:hypothetical protein